MDSLPSDTLLPFEAQRVPPVALREKMGDYLSLRHSHSKMTYLDSAFNAQMGILVEFAVYHIGGCILGFVSFTLVIARTFTIRALFLV